MADEARRLLEAWFAGRGWSPLAYQREAWAAFRAGECGLVHAPTGVGKTLAAWGGPLLEGLTDGDEEPGLRVLWLTPLRALARDTVASLVEPLAEIGLDWRVEARIGDTSSSVKARQRKRMPHALVTTPESLTLLLSYPEAPRLFDRLDAVVVDEWHELMGSKRGTQTELALARLRAWRPRLRTWGLSATLGNLDEAMRTLLGSGAPQGRLVRGPGRPTPEVRCLIPDGLDRFPWSGHIGLRLLPDVLDVLEGARTSLVFTNTRAQAEIWHRAIMDARPEWEDSIGLHHGSLAPGLRAEVEGGLASGTLRAVVCTSSLDLGIDFSPVDTVLQIGSPKGVGRFLQRAGRSGHTPEGVSRVVCVPTHALEIAEFAAARVALEEGRIEPRRPLRAPLDVLVQHLVTVGLGGGFDAADLFTEIRSTHAYSELTTSAWEWCLDFASRGGPALQAYDRYARIREVEPGQWIGSEERTIARHHRMSVGTITADGPMQIRFLKGGSLGTVEESFVSRLRPGDAFTFAGRRLTLVRVRDMTAYVRTSRGRANGVVPRWMGGRMPLSSELGTTLLRVFAGEVADTAEGRALDPLFELQSQWSALPRPDRLLLERLRTREGHHLFVYPFLGRRVHEGIGAIVALRLSRLHPATIRISANDYGIELLSRDPFPVGDGDSDWRGLFEPRTVEADLMAAINEAELGRRHFREIARVSGLVLSGVPGRRKSARQLQISSGLIHDVLARYDPDNLLLRQTRDEVLEREVERGRLREGLKHMASLEPIEAEPPRLTPLAFPIWAERIQAQLSSESWRERVGRMAVRLEKAADRGDVEGTRAMAVGARRT